MAERLIMTWQRWRDAASLLIVLGTAIAILIWTGITLWDHFEDEPFAPLEAYPVVVEQEPIYVGGAIEARDGVCNTTNEPREVSIHVRLQAQLVDPETGSQRIGPTYDLVGSSDAPFEVRLYHGCIATQPVNLTIPEEAPPGPYTLTVTARTVSSTGQVQILTTASEVFEVVRDGNP